MASQPWADDHVIIRITEESTFVYSPTTHQVWNLGNDGKVTNPSKTAATNALHQYLRPDLFQSKAAR